MFQTFVNLSAQFFPLFSSVSPQYWPTSPAAIRSVQSHYLLYLWKPNPNKIFSFFIPTCIQPSTPDFSQWSDWFQLVKEAESIAANHSAKALLQLRLILDFFLLSVFSAWLVLAKPKTYCRESCCILPSEWVYLLSGQEFLRLVQPQRIAVTMVDLPRLR